MAGLAHPDAMRGFVDNFGLDFPQAISVDGRLWARFGVPAQPAWVFIDDGGQVDTYLDELPREELVQILDAMIAS